jgi:hypothetical protein
LNIAYTIVLSIFHFCLLSAFAAEREKKFLSGALAVAPKISKVHCLLAYQQAVIVEEKVS